MYKYFTKDRFDPNRILPIKTYINEMLEKSKDDYCFYLYFFKKGYANVMIDSRNFICSSPSLLCISENQSLKFNNPSNFECDVVVFNPEFLNCNMKLEFIRHREYLNFSDIHDLLKLEPFLSDDFADSYITGFSPELPKKLEILFETMNAELLQQSHGRWSCNARSYFMDVIQISETFFNHPDKARNKFLCCYDKSRGNEDAFKIMDYIWANYDNPKLSVINVSEKFNICKTTLNKYVKSVSGYTFYDYVIRLRFMLASKKLRFTSIPVEEIATTTGFKNISHFCNSFKKEFGLSPNNFRRQVVSDRKSDTKMKLKVQGDI